MIMVKIDTNLNVNIYKGRIKASLLANQIRQLYGNCKFIAIDDSERNMRYIFITDPVGRVTKIEYFEPWISNVKDLYLEVGKYNFSKVKDEDFLSNHGDENLEEFKEAPLEILRISNKMQKEIKGLTGTFFPELVKTLPFHVEIGITLSCVQEQRIRKGRLIKQFITPLC